MKRLSLLLTAAAFVLLLWSGASGEYYQYTDKDGVVRFTDDSSVIPEDQQPEVKTYESIQSEPQRDMTDEDSAQVEDAAEETEIDTSKIPNSENLEKDKELKATREDLRQTFDALQAEKNALGPPPPRNARTVVRNKYNDKVSELNRKIDDYDKQSKEFDEKVKAYNSQVSK